MQQFKVSQEGYKKFRKRWLIIMISIIAIVLAFFSLVKILSPAKGDTNGLMITIPVMLIVFGFSLFRSLRKQKQLLLSYSVTISDNEISREQPNTPTLTINFMEIKEIIKTRKGSFLIKGLTRSDIITIPYWIENAALLEQQLAALAPISTDVKDPFKQKLRIPLSIGTLASMIAVYAATNKVLVGVCGTFLAAIFIWSFYEVRINKNLPKNTRRGSWIFLLVLASIIYTVYMKLSV